MMQARADKITEILNLSEEIIGNIELSNATLESIAMKTLRLARLCEDKETMAIMKFEVSGYPSTPAGFPLEVFKLGKKAGRVSVINRDGVNREVMYGEAISTIENRIKFFESNITNTPTKSDSMAIMVSLRQERDQLRKTLSEDSKKIGMIKAKIYDYATRRNHQIKFSKAASDIFSRIRVAADARIDELIPEGMQKIESIYENLESENSEDWSNAVHSCRRILQLLADNVFPPQDDVIICENPKKIIKLGADNYINRLIRYVETKSSSKRFNEIVGSHVKYLGERLDSIFMAAQKGSHSNIESREEADRYVVFTYMAVNDILSL